MDKRYNLWVVVKTSNEGNTNKCNNSNNSNDNNDINEYAKQTIYYIIPLL